jgi:CHAT domain-containing protein
VFPAYRQLGRPLPASLAAVSAALGRDDILIAPLGLPGETLTIAVTRAGLVWASTPMHRSQLLALVARIRAAIDAGRHDDRARFDLEAAQSLYRALIPAPLEPLLRRHRHILYYASGALATIPAALLIAAPARKGAPPDWLVRTHSISVVTTLAARPVIATAPGDRFLGIGAPRTTVASVASGDVVAGSDFGVSQAAALPALPFAQRELRAIARQFPVKARHLLIGLAATKTALRNLPPDRYQLIAIATHGLVADALPGLTQPALVMTPNGDDGLLTASDIAGLRLDADWVILSACDTASGSDPQAGSYSGLASAFFQAGARALLVSHWPVRDDAAARLTVTTLSATRKGRNRATALQQAMLALMRDRTIPGAANPAIWAPFVLVER